jgi:hypothetical protein
MLMMHAACCLLLLLLLLLLLTFATARCLPYVDVSPKCERPPPLVASGVFSWHRRFLSLSV